ncbi:MAG: NTP transferase domain-containing protein [Hyphomicrobiaceae bacterium]
MTTPEVGSTRRHGPQVAAIVLAAGVSRRFGAANKLLAEVEGRALVARVVSAVLKSRARPVVVVTGHEAERVRAALAGADVTFVHNDRYQEGMGGSVATGIRALGAESDGALVCLGDMPETDAALLDRLIAAFEGAGGAAVVVPTTPSGEQRNPVLWPRGRFADLAALEGEVGAKRLLKGATADLLRVAVEETAQFVDIDTEQELARYRSDPPGSSRGGRQP